MSKSNLPNLFFKNELKSSNTILQFYISAFSDTDRSGFLIPLPDGRVQCLQCGKQISNIKNGKRHLRMVHQSNAPSMCKICKKFFKNKQTIDTHMRQSHGITPSMMNNAIQIPFDQN